MTDNRSDNDLRDEAPAEQGSSGGNLATDVASQAELDAIEDPEGRERATKQDDIDNGEAMRNQRPRD